MKNLVLIAFLTIAFVGCGKAGFNFVNVPDETNQSVSTPNDQVVCDPFDSGGKFSERHGIIGELFYLEDSDPRVASADAMMSQGRQVENLIMYINKLFVPTRPFDRGFRT